MSFWVAVKPFVSFITDAYLRIFLLDYLRVSYHDVASGTLLPLSQTQHQRQQMQMQHEQWTQMPIEYAKSQQGELNSKRQSYLSIICLLTAIYEIMLGSLFYVDIFTY